MIRTLLISILLLTASLHVQANSRQEQTKSFDKSWRFYLGDVTDGKNPTFDDSKWRVLDVPHDWSIEGEFSARHPAGNGGGALPGGIGWYRKTFTLPVSAKDSSIFIEFDGVYRNSDVWINGHHLGKRPYGYISFQYELTPHLNFGSKSNVLAVRVDNSKQPNSRWYSGSGIYRHVWLTTLNKISVAHWGTFVTTPQVSDESATVDIKTNVRNDLADQQLILRTAIYDAAGREVAQTQSTTQSSKSSVVEVAQVLNVRRPALWSIENPYLYKAVSELRSGRKLLDRYETPFGIRYFSFDREKGFAVNGKPVKIKGVCNHHDLGALGAAVNTRALERQLEILKAMGANGLRTSHNPPAPELLELCDRMGFIVMDEAFDMWKKKKTEFDYHLDWDEWHKRDLEDMLLRDRNHPSVFIWSIGNEIMEQRGDASGVPIAKELAAIVKSLDQTRPITSACNTVTTDNHIINSGALDLVGLNYSQAKAAEFPTMFPGKTLIWSETTSALATTGSYDMPSDQVRRWPPRPATSAKWGNDDYSCSAYDNCSAPWGSTHEESWKLLKKYDYLTGMYIWTGFDYLGEPTPYPWPARSSYFGIVDLAGVPKDTYYMYQSEWTNGPVLHLFPHWNWRQGDEVDVWAYSNSDEVELFLNARSLGTKPKTPDELHMTWRLKFEPGTLKAVSRNGGKVVLTREVQTAGAPAKLILAADRKTIKADGSDLSFVSVKVVDANGNLVPHAENLVKFAISGPAKIAGVDNGNQISHEPFKSDQRKAFHGRCLAIIQAKEQRGKVSLRATSEGLVSGELVIEMR